MINTADCPVEQKTEISLPQQLSREKSIYDKLLIRTHIPTICYLYYKKPFILNNAIRVCIIQMRISQSAKYPIYFS